ncbi:unnamed protein product [Notodromas monacha]|uniref:Sushi domain-containing protein 2 n=1 Tax=Notodromas monacha TaxID=399045 RepID=A0A7R9GEX4_9CRUS|nr:unnamed protein product [Notodromas monacha]CAG0918295.1 unnamed protein product [Notodromas monacha]
MRTLIDKIPRILKTLDDDYFFGAFNRSDGANVIFSAVLFAPFPVWTTDDARSDSVHGREKFGGIGEGHTTNQMLTVTVAIDFQRISVSALKRRTIFAAVPTGELYPTSGTNLASCVDCNSPQIDFPTTFYFYNSPKAFGFVNNNGGITFARSSATFNEFCGTPSSQTFQLIAPFWARTDTTKGGTVSYQVTQSATVLEKAKTDISLAFPGASGFNLRWALVVTWNQVRAQSAISGTNTFQTVLTTDGVNSFVIYYYNNIGWAKNSDAAFDARVGMDLLDGNADHKLNLAGSCTSSISNIASQSNIDSPGKFVFKVDAVSAVQPNDCSSNAYNNNMSTSVSPSNVGLYGGELVTLSDACVDITKTNVRCAIDDPMGSGLIYGTAKAVDANSIQCLTPLLFRVGRVDIYFEFTGTNGVEDIVMKRIFVAEKPDKTITIAKTLVGTVTRCEVTWTTSWLTSASVEVIFQPFDSKIAPKVLATVPNTGSTSVDASLFYSDPTKVIGNVGIQAVGSGSLRPKVWANMEEFYHLFWPGGYEADCVEFVKNTVLPYTPASCPPTEAQARIDPRFLIDENAPIYYHPKAKVCYSALVPTVTAIQECCYDSGGLIICKGTDGGTRKRVTPRSLYWLHFEYDIIPFYMCCKNSKISQTANEEHCKSYYTKRPSDCGTNYQPPRPGGINGDPHIVTLDGLDYTFNGKGEYHLVKGPDCQIQARFGTTAAATSATLIKAVSYKCTSMPKSGVHLQQSESGTAVQIYTQDGVPLTVTDTTALDANVTITKTGPTSYLISGTDVDLEVGLAGGAMWTNFYVSQTHKNRGTVKGLLGNFDDNPINDLVPKTGNALSFNADLRTIHNNFGETWRVSAAESTMIYVLGMTYEKANDATFTPTFTVAADKSTFPLTVQLACQDNKACYFDYQVTKDLSLASGTKSTQEKLANNKNTLTNGATCPALSSVANGQVTSNGQTVGSTAVYSCNAGFNIFGSAEVTCTASGVWSGSAECLSVPTAGKLRHLNVWLARVLDRLLDGQSI